MKNFFIGCVIGILLPVVAHADAVMTPSDVTPGSNGSMDDPWRSAIGMATQSMTSPSANYKVLGEVKIVAGKPKIRAKSGTETDLADTDWGLWGDGPAHSVTGKGTLHAIWTVGSRWNFQKSEFDATVTVRYIFGTKCQHYSGSATWVLTKADGATEVSNSLIDKTGC